MSVLFALIEKIIVVVVIVVVEGVFYQIQLSLKANWLKNHWKREGGNFLSQMSEHPIPSLSVPYGSLPIQFYRFCLVGISLFQVPYRKRTTGTIDDRKTLLFLV